MENLTLKLRGEAEPTFENWVVVGGSQVLETGCGVVYIVSPEMAAKIEAGDLTESEELQLLIRTSTCAMRGLEQLVSQMPERRDDSNPIPADPN